MDYEIYSINKKGRVVYHIMCRGYEIEEKLKKLVVKYPNRKWVFGMSIHFRKDIGGVLKTNW